MVQRSKILKQLVSYLKLHSYKFNVRGNEYLYIQGSEFILYFPNEQDIVLIDSLRNWYRFSVFRFERALLVLQNFRFKILKEGINDVDLSLLVSSPAVLSNLSLNMSLTGAFVPVYRLV